MSDKQHHHGIVDSVRSLVFESEPDTSTPSVSAPTPTTPTTPTTSTPTPFTFNLGERYHVSAAPDAPPSTLSSFVSADVPVGPEAEGFYQTLLAKTNFDTSDTALTIQKFVEPLKALITDPKMLFKAAVATAKSQKGVSEDDILAVFDSLKASLSQVGDSFKAKASAFEAKEITSRETRLTEIQTQIATLQAEQQQVAADLSEAQAKSARTQSGFNSALQRRSAEIDAQKAHFAALLK